MVENFDFSNSLKKNGRYVNFNANKRVRRTLIDFFLWKIGAYNIKNEKLIVPNDFIYPINDKPFVYNAPWVMWIGHCTFLIKNSNVKILTDPIWNNNCSPFTFIGPIRRHEAPLDIKQLNKINYVLISHNHYDHLDLNSILELHKKFNSQLTWVVPKGLKRWFIRKGIENVVELDWWENYEDELINICSVPAQHYSGRNIFDGNKSLWTGYVLTIKNDQKKLYFTGDSGYNDIDFKMIGNKFKKIDLSLIPIGTYIPRKFMSPVHTDPEGAVKIHKDVNSEFSIGMHWKTFHLSDENMLLPPYELYLSLKKENIDPSKFIVLEPGSYVNW